MRPPRSHRPASGAPGPDGLERHAAGMRDMPRLLARNVRQLGVLVANIHPVDGSGGAMARHQRQIGNAVAAAKLSKRAVSESAPRRPSSAPHRQRIQNARTKPFIGDALRIPGGQTPQALLQSHFPVHLATTPFVFNIAPRHMTSHRRSSSSSGVASAPNPAKAWGKQS